MALPFTLQAAMDALCAAHLTSEPDIPTDLPAVSRTIYEMGKVTFFV